MSLRRFIHPCQLLALMASGTYRRALPQRTYDRQPSIHTQGAATVCSFDGAGVLVSLLPGSFRTGILEFVEVSVNTLDQRGYLRVQGRRFEGSNRRLMGDDRASVLGALCRKIAMQESYFGVHHVNFFELTLCCELGRHVLCFGGATTL